MLHAFAMMLKPRVYNAGDEVTEIDSVGAELFILDRGRVEVLGRDGQLKTEFSDGQVFGELSMLMTKRRRATVKALTYCAIYTLDKRDFSKVLMDRPQFAKRMMQVARERYNIIVDAQEWLPSDGLN